MPPPRSPDDAPHPGLTDGVHVVLSSPKQGSLSVTAAPGAALMPAMLAPKTASPSAMSRHGSLLSDELGHGGADDGAGTADVDLVGELLVSSSNTDAPDEV